MEVQQAQQHQEDLEKSASRSSKKPSNRPAMQIYRPPGLRSGSDGSSTANRPRPAAGVKPPDNFKEENNNVRCSDGFVSTSPESDDHRLTRTASSLSSESAVSQKSLGSSGPKPTNGVEKRTKLPSPPKREPKRKVMSDKEMEDAATSLRALQLATNAAELEQWITGQFTCEELGEQVGSSLCQHAIEGGGGKGVAKICGSLKDAFAVKGLVKGLLVSLAQYYDCRDKLRADHFRMWISFLNFVSDVYSNLGGADSEISGVVFQVFDYLLRPPVLETLKIEELECLISSLLSIGYDLERECPDRLAVLKDQIRDAFIDMSEPWARKMILLLLELGASGWKLPPEANDYYFHQSSS